MIPTLLIRYVDGGKGLTRGGDISTKNALHALLHVAARPFDLVSSEVFDAQEKRLNDHVWISILSAAKKQKLPPEIQEVSLWLAFPEGEPVGVIFLDAQAEAEELQDVQKLLKPGTYRIYHTDERGGPIPTGFELPIE